ncbi:EAL domain-containing protein (putative c-di-GMP-specific phosphodiesterase class I) [Aliiruegeria haliotis]|uniref:EAL domain-containing protein (Putative c-di-GMP-specific phosphodiesterase class I) n=1 Tax=Aliiruegeria haliotis TaxID=1280846 RepID=A0A2T0RSX6_9RHOB|nr:EAL domain-containing protein [Aliiruegeria haliotis]PRY24299.1 EAL domain-containing protein (putative c-di-GMP-specific phosphodiesterase class I) [Aliiruegeria haliotis]
MQAVADGIAPGALEGVGNPLAAAVTVRDKNILAMVRRSLERRDVLLAYQPVVDARSPERIAFFEGLVRVLDDTGRVIPAAEFMGAIESDEIGRMIDCISLELGLAALKAAPGLRLSINMSARSIGYPPWMEALTQGLTDRPEAAERLIVEITESSAILLPDVTMVFMQNLQDRGISFALDDFGAGYTAFRYLRDLDFDILKVAGEFIRGIHANPDNQVLTRALIHIAEEFEMFTVAESVENAEDANLLSAFGVDCMQGYYFGVPTTQPTWDAFPESFRKAV